MVDKLRKAVTAAILNLRGWRTKRKLIVFESDDWGSIRMPNKKTYCSLLRRQIPVNQSPYCMFDSLESEMDLDVLFQTLLQFKDVNGNAPILTANFNMANPNFEKIQAAGFDEFYYEVFTDTYKRYPYHRRSFDTIKDGISKKIIFPQLHGREHLNASFWLASLRARDPHTMIGFDHSFCGFDDSTTLSKYGFMAALDGITDAHYCYHSSYLQDAVKMFKEVFGFSPRSFIAPCYVWSSRHEAILSENRIEYLQGIPTQLAPSDFFGGQYKPFYHYLGQENPFGSIYGIRNCFFEPSLYDPKDSVAECLRRLRIAFMFGKPAVIGTHRLNYMGTLDPRNRDRNVKLLAELLTRVLKMWPDVEFVSTTQLLDLVKGKTKSTLLQ